MSTKMFKRGQIVKISRIDSADDPHWLDLFCQVADIPPYQYPFVSTLKLTRLVPLSDRPDASTIVGAREWFVWPTDDLELAEGVDVEDE